MAIRVPASHAHNSQCRRDSIGMRSACWSGPLHHKRYTTPKSQRSRDWVYRPVGQSSALNSQVRCDFAEFSLGAQSRNTKGLQLRLGAFLCARSFHISAMRERTEEAACAGPHDQVVAELYITTLGRTCGTISVSATAGCGRRERSQPAESHARGMTNSDQPQSRQTRISGEGVMGG
jgi:hypothetical protein